MTNVMARCEMQGTEGLLQSLMEEVIAIGELTKITTMEEVFDAVLLGDTVLLMDGDDFALQASTKHFPTPGRSVICSCGKGEYCRFSNSCSA